MQSAPLVPELRPGELVFSYIEREFLSNSESEGKRLPSIEQLAKHLNVSFPTVRSVVRKLAASGRLETIQGRGTFVRAVASKKERPLLLASNMTFFNSDHALNWSETIYMGAVRMAASVKRGISMMPVANELPVSEERIHRELIRRMDQIDMLMLLPLRNSEKVGRAYDEAGKPVVEINPPFINSTSNFVSSDFYAAGFKVGQSLYRSGRRRFLFLGPVERLDHVISTKLLLMGFSDGCRRDQDATVQFRVMNAMHDGLVDKSFRDAQESFRFDGILCSGDILAVQILKTLRELRCDVPNEVSVVAGTGLFVTSSDELKLTRISQPMEQLGANAVRILCHRFENQCVSVPGLYLTTPINVGDTTRPAENEFFKNEGALR